MYSKSLGPKEHPGQSVSWAGAGCHFSSCVQRSHFPEPLSLLMSITPRVSLRHSPWARYCAGLQGQIREQAWVPRSKPAGVGGNPKLEVRSSWITYLQMYRDQGRGSYWTIWLRNLNGEQVIRDS